jgi:hypothetical protein
LALWPASARAAAGGENARGARSALLVFAPAGESELASLPGVSVGILSGAQGSYSTAQLLLDIGQGARVSSAAYGSAPARLTLVGDGAGGGSIAGWQRDRARARGAPADLRPGLLASRVPGGAAYAGVYGATPDAPAAADGDGHVAAVSLGSPGSIAARAQALLAGHRLVVADLPAGSSGRQALDRIAARRTAGELLLVVQRPSSAPAGGLLWIAAAGAGMPTGGQLTSDTTHERGLVADTDLAPSILGHLGAGVPAAMDGTTLRSDGRLSGAALRETMARLQVIGARRLPALAWLLAAWALLVGVCSLWGRAARARALRAGALGVMWAPVVTLLPAAVAPGAAGEYAMIALICPALGALSDSLLGWPRAPVAPALAAVIVLGADALAGSQLLMRSLVGPDPALGARFYGIGNVLKSGLAVLVLAAVAGALYPAARGRRAAVSMACAGALLAVLEGAARLGAGVGGVILVCFAFAVATAMLLPDAGTRRRALIVLASPVIALVVLGAVDLLSAGAGGHFSGSILHAHSASDVRDVLVRRYEAAGRELLHGAMPLATLLALAAGAAALRWRTRMLAPVHGDPAWLAALCGSLAAGVVGALVEDSGPVLLVVAVFSLACVCCYLWASPQARRRSPGTPRAARSRALRLPEVPAR